MNIDRQTKYSVPEIALIALAVWLAASPWALGYAANQFAVVNDLI